MPAPPRVTVFLPTYNRPWWLPGAIESVLSQTYQDFKLVVSDNASVDETPQVVRRYDDPRLSYVRREVNRGWLDHFNRCLAEVETEYVTFLTDDDLMMPEKLGVEVELLDAQSRVGLVHSAFTEIDGTGTVTRPYMDWTWGLTADTVESGPSFIEQCMRWSNRVSISTVLLRTSALPAGFFPPPDGPAADLGMWLRMALRGDVAFLARPLTRFRNHTDSLSAALGTVTEGAYVQGFDVIEMTKSAKLRFLEQHGAELADPTSLRAMATAAARRELLESVWGRTNQRRRLTETATLLAKAARHDPRVFADLRAWRLLASSVIGASATNRLKSTVLSRRAA